MRISDWSSDVCSSYLVRADNDPEADAPPGFTVPGHRTAPPGGLLGLGFRGGFRRRFRRGFRGSLDRKSAVQGKSGSVRVDLGGRRIIKTTKQYNAGMIAVVKC